MSRTKCQLFSMASRCTLWPQPLLPSCPLSLCCPSTPSTMTSPHLLQTTEHMCPEEAVTSILHTFA